MSIQQKWHIVWKAPTTIILYKMLLFSICYTTFSSDHHRKYTAADWKLQCSGQTLMMQMEALLFLYEVELSWRSSKRCFHLTLPNAEAILVQGFLDKQLSLVMFLTYFNARHGTWFTHHLEEGSFTLRTDAQWTEDNTAQGKKKLRQGRENKKGIKVFKCNFKKILRQGSFKKNWWSFSTRKWSLPFQADDPGHLQVIAVRKIGMLKHLKLLAWFQIDVKCIVMKSNARIRSEAHPGLFAPGSTLTWDITAEVPCGFGFRHCLHHPTFTSFKTCVNLETPACIGWRFWHS